VIADDDKKNVALDKKDSPLKANTDFAIEKESENKKKLDAEIELKNTKQKITEIDEKVEVQKVEKNESMTEIKTQTVKKTVVKNIDSAKLKETDSQNIEKNDSAIQQKIEKTELDNKKVKIEKEVVAEKIPSSEVTKRTSLLSEEQLEEMKNEIKEEPGNNAKDFLSAMFSHNPVFVLMLGLGPALAVTTKLTNGIALGLIVLLTTLLSNVVISALKGFIPAKIRLPFYLTVTGSFVSVIIIFIQTFLPSLASSLGIFLPLTAVNSVILERVEVFACKRKISNTVLNSLGTGIGFMLVLILISFIREFFGTLQLDFSDFGLGIYSIGKISILGFPIYEHAKIFATPAGAFLTLGLLLAVKQMIYNHSNKNIED
jgi:electron transport complex protein RnfE